MVHRVARDDRPIYRHRQACYGFRDVVEQVGGRWGCLSPCPEWDARGVLEHVIGFHEVLLLRPLGVKVRRPHDDIPGRWPPTQTAIFTSLDAHWGRPVDMPNGNTLDVGTLLPMLTTEVLVHTWDLARAIGVDVTFNPELCERALEGAQRNETGLQDSGMFANSIEVPIDADAQTHLIALLGRDLTVGAVLLTAARKIRAPVPGPPHRADDDSIRLIERSHLSDHSA